MSTTTTSTLSNAIATNVIDRLVLDYGRQNAFLPNLVWQEDISDEPTLTHVFPQFASLTAASTTQGTDLTPSTLTVNSAASLTVAEVAVLVELTRIGAAATGGRVDLDVVGRQCGLAVKDKLETDIGATFSSFTNAVGTSGSALVLSDIDNALYTLRANNVPVGNPSNNNAPLQGIQCVLSEKQLQYFLTALRTANYFMTFTEAKNAIILTEAGSVPAQLRGAYMGVPFYGNNDLGTANSGVDAVGAMFGPTAIGLVTKGGPQSMALERPRGRSDDLTVMQWYGTGVVVSSYGVKIVNKAT
jgi:hypothetical protein